MWTTPPIGWKTALVLIIQSITSQIYADIKLPLTDFWLQVKNKKDLHDSLQDFITPEVLDGDNQYRAGDHGLQVPSY